MSTPGAAVAQIAAHLIDLRHRLHRVPEVGLDLPRTGALVRAQIEPLGLPVLDCQGATGFVVVLRGRGRRRPLPASAASGRPAATRPIVLLRADMDALPIREESGEPFAATGAAMHACGHDLHTAALVGALRVLAGLRDHLAGDVVFMFQPGEEGYQGARRMIEQGVLKAAGRMPDHAYAAHVWSSAYPARSIYTRPGPMLASVDDMTITVRGRGGHGSVPHQCLDPVPVAAQIVTQVQVMVAREFAVFDPVVATCGYVRAGVASNVIPDTAELRYTLRAFSPAARARLLKRLPQLARSIAAAAGMRAECTPCGLFPVTVNDEDEFRFSRAAVRAAFPHRWLDMTHPAPAAEDFSLIAQVVPSCYLGVSAVPEGVDHATAPSNHSAQARFADYAVPTCAALLAELAWRRLAATPATGTT